MIQSPRLMTYRRYKKKIKMTFKKWQKYGFNDQERIIKRYNVILLGHKTTKEKLMALFKRSKPDKRKENRKKVSSVLKNLVKGIEYFSKEVSKFSIDEKKTNRKANHLSKELLVSLGNSANTYEGLTNSSRNYGALTNTSRDYRALTG